MINVSKTQLSNISVITGLIVIGANQFGWILEQNKVAFILAGIWSLGFTIYNFWQRYRKGDIYLSGIRK